MQITVGAHLQVVLGTADPYHERTSEQKADSPWGILLRKHF